MRRVDGSVSVLDCWAEALEKLPDDLAVAGRELD